MINLQRKNATLFINLDLVQPAAPALQLRKAIICLKKEEEGVKRYAVALQRESKLKTEILHQLYLCCTWSSVRVQRCLRGFDLISSAQT